MKSPIAAVVLAAGAGTRMKSSLPKVLHQVAGKPMLRHVLDSVARLKPARVVGVVAPGDDQVAAAFAPHPTAIQHETLGTGDATRAAPPALKGHAGPVLMVYADSPLLTTVKIGKGANVTAGSVITEDVPADALAFGRARQVTKKGRARPLRAKLKEHALAAKRAKGQ
jgi:bifunctional UDP-N-acetylglucosamine pyrophosphorylase/glucosamine-1-phosphate N-acetyltransferase